MASTFAYFFPRKEQLHRLKALIRYFFDRSLMQLLIECQVQY